MMQLNRNLTNEEQAALFQAMTVEQLKALKGTPVNLNWSDKDLEEIAAYQQEDAAHITILQRMSPIETDSFIQFKNMSMNEKMQKTGLSQTVIETIESDASHAVYGDILRYCKHLAIPKALLLESLMEEELV